MTTAKLRQEPPKRPRHEIVPVAPECHEPRDVSRSSEVPLFIAGVFGTSPYKRWLCIADALWSLAFAPFSDAPLAFLIGTPAKRVKEIGAPSLKHPFARVFTADCAASLLAISKGRNAVSLPAALMSEGLWIFMGRFADVVALMDIYGYEYGYAHQYSFAGNNAANALANCRDRRVQGRMACLGNACA